MVERVVLSLVVAVTLLVAAGYVAKDTHTIKHWHPMFVEPALGYFGLPFFGHEHTPRAPRQRRRFRTRSHHQLLELRLPRSRL